MSKGYSLHIGLNSVNSHHYDGWSGALQACENDAEAIAAIAHSLKYSETTLLKTKQATREAVIKTLERYASILTKDDMFLLSYSGHGGQLPDLNGDEIKDGKDETWCLYNGELLDDELYNLFTKFAKGVRIVVLSDSCHSGSVTREYAHLGAALVDAHPKAAHRFMPQEVARRTFTKNKTLYEPLCTDNRAAKKELQATLRLISGCQDNQTALDGDFNGLFTQRLLQTWNNGLFKGNYNAFHKAILKLMPSYQTPVHSINGKCNLTFDKQIPFQI
jgi:metacaspase-1